MVEIRDATDADIPAVTAIHNALLTTTTYEWTETLHTVEERTTWLHEQQAADLPVLVADDDGVVVGWTSYGPFRDDVRWPCYRVSAEHTIHVAESHWGQGLGRLLMAELIDRARAGGIRTLIAGIDSTNTGSINFHARLGFVECARIRECGRKHGRWLDLVLMQLVLPD